MTRRAFPFLPAGLGRSLAALLMVLCGGALSLPAHADGTGHRHTVLTYRFDIEMDGKTYGAEMAFVSEMKDGIVNMDPFVHPRFEILRHQIKTDAPLTLIYTQLAKLGSGTYGLDGPAYGTRYSENGPTYLFADDFKPVPNVGLMLLNCEVPDLCDPMNLTLANSELVYTQTEKRFLTQLGGPSNSQINLYSSLTYEAHPVVGPAIRFTLKNLRISEKLGPEGLHPGFERTPVIAPALAGYDALPPYPADTCFNTRAPKNLNTDRCREIRRVSISPLHNLLQPGKPKVTLEDYIEAAKKLAPLGDPASLDEMLLGTARQLVKKQPADARTLLALAQTVEHPGGRSDYFLNLQLTTLGLRLAPKPDETAIAQAETRMAELGQAETAPDLLYSLERAAYDLIALRLESGADEAALRDLGTCSNAMEAIGGSAKYSCYNAFLKGQVFKLTGQQRSLIEARKKAYACARGLSLECLDKEAETP